MKTVLVLCVALGFFLLALEADAGRVILEERNLKTASGTVGNIEVASSEDSESAGTGADADSGDDSVPGNESHRIFPELKNPRGNNQLPENSNPGRRG